jgi:hypothetical protein
MQSIERRRAHALIAAIGLIVAALVYVDAHRTISSPPSALADEGAAQGRSGRASEAEAALARTNLSGRMQAALGDAFGGAWFEPSTAQMHVGVTSAASRRLAEAVAADAGLSELVTETPVHSTWSQLEATQEDWDRQLVDLFERGQVGTSLAVDRNSVQIELASSVPRSRRTMLEREAVLSGNVEVVISPRRSLFAIQAEQCKKWVQFAAYCDPTIVAGTTLASEKDGSGKRKTTCSTGSAVRLKDRSTGENATKTYVLTAGHCIHTGGGVGKKWYAFDKGSNELEVGPAGSYLNGEIDVGVVEVKPPNWAKANDPVPVVPTTALWDTNFETNPNKVSFEAKPKKSTKTCVIGQRSLEVCGTIIDENVTVTFKGEPVATKKLYKVELGKDKAGNQTRAGAGDSGGPMRSPDSVSTIEGVFVGFTFEDHTNENEGKVIYFHSLETAFAELKAQKGLELELLKSGNEKRKHPVVTADKYPVTFSAEETSEHQFTAFEMAVKCTKGKFHGELTKSQQEATPAVVELTPTYESCTALSLPTTFTGNGCKYKLTLTGEPTEGSYSANGDIVCPVGKAIQFDVSGFCTVTLPPQSGLKVPNLSNSGNHVVMSAGSIEKVKVQKQGLCGSSETTTGVYDMSKAVTVSGTSGGEATKIDIGGE